MHVTQMFLFFAYSSSVLHIKRQQIQWSWTG